MNLFELFSKAIDIMTHWAQFVNYVQAAVLAAETDKSATGDQKREAVVNAVLSGMKQDFGIDLTGFEPVIISVINLVVAVFNNLGVFTHKSK